MTPPLRVLPYRDIAAEVAERLLAARGDDPLAAWPEEVIVPSTGMSQAIAAEILRRAPNGIAALQLQSIETLARRIANAAGEFPRVATEAERRLAMRIAVRSVDHPIMESRGMAAMLERSYRDVRDSGVTLAEIAPRLRGERKRAILRAWEQYERTLQRLGAIDPADLLRRATELASSSVPPQLVAGFYDMTFAQRRLIDALAAAGRVAAMWIPTGMTIPGGLLAEPVATNAARPATENTAYDTRQSEIAGVCAEVAALLASGTPPSEIAIVARSLEPYDIALLERLASERGFRTTLGSDVPLIAHRLGRAAVTLLRLRERGFPRGEVLELVRDGLRFRTRVAVDAVDYQTRRARIAGGSSEELAVLRGRNAEVDAYIALVGELEELTAQIDLAGLTARFRLESELDLAAADALDQIADLFRRANVSDPGSIVDAIEQVTLPIVEGDDARPRIWAGDLLRFRGRTFTRVFAIRMQDDVFPQRRLEDPLLRDGERRALGVREIGDGADEERLLFQLLQDSAAHVSFSYAASDGFGKVLRPSRFVRELDAVAGEVRPPAARVAPARRQLQLLVRAGTRSPFDGFLTTVRTQIEQRLQSVSPTHLEDFGECPQKFLLKHVLGVEDIEHPERELQIDRREKGILDHRILESFYRSDDRAPELLDALIDEAFDRHEEKVPPFNRTVRDIERRATKRLLREFVERDLAELEEQGLEPRFFEYRFGQKHREPDHPEPFVVHASGVPIRIEGTIDRIDASGTRFRIVDYKSGKALRHVDLGSKIDRGVRLQLALYAMAVAEFFEAGAENVSATIKPLVFGHKLEKFAFALAEKRDGLLETLDIFVSSILEGRFPAFAAGDFEPCKYCPVNHSCRTRHDSDERHAAQQHSEPRALLEELR